MQHKSWRSLLVALLGASLVQVNVGGEGTAEAEENSGGQEALPQGQESEGLCFGDGGEAAELSLESDLNATGHWLAKVRLQHVVQRPERQGERAPVHLQVRRWTGRGGAQGDARLVTLQATLTGPSASSTLKDYLPWGDVNSPQPSSDSEPRQRPCSPAKPCPTCVAPSPAPACPSPSPSPVPCPECPVPPTHPPFKCPSPCATPPPCPSCPACSAAQQCPSPCAIPPPCPACPTHENCPSPCATPPPCPACPTPQKCPSPCATPPPCPAWPTPPKCPSPCATPPPCPACPSCPKATALGYERYHGHGAYRMHLMPLYWFEAQATCEREGAHLAIINSQAEADILARIIRNQPITVPYVLMGFHDLYYEGNYYTVLDKPLHSSGYFKWASGEPNNMGDEDCGGIYVNVMGLNDHKCRLLTAPFLCEMP